MAIGQGRIRMVLSRLLALQGDDQSVGIRQKQLAADLGLSAPVVSMAMTALKKGGYARKNADRSWSVSETPIYDNRDRMDMLLAEVRQLQVTVRGLGRIALPVRSPAAEAEHPQPAAGHARPAAEEQRHEELLEFDDQSWPEAWKDAAHAMRFFAWGGQSGTVYLRGDPPQAVPQGWMPLASAEFNKDGCVFQRPDGTLAYTREDIVRYYGEFKRKYAGLGTVPVECIDVNSRGNK